MAETHDANWHDNKLCAIACCQCRINLEELKPLVKDPKYICAECGRAAADADSLCHAEPL